MKKIGWIVLGAVLLAAAAVAGVLLLRRPPLIETRDVEAVFLYVSPHGYKELTDPQQRREAVKRLNSLGREDMPDEDDRKGHYAQVRIFYQDGTWDSLTFLQSEEDYTTASGILFPAGEYMSLYPAGYFRVEDGTREALTALFDRVEQTPSRDLPEERSTLSPLNNRRR